MIERSHHDMGGLPAGKVEPTEHDYEEWERGVDTPTMLLSPPQKTLEPTTSWVSGRSR